MVTTEDGTKYFLEKIVAIEEEAEAHHWIRNHDGSGWYATRIVEVHGSGVEISYAREGAYPEAITEIRSIRDPSVKITTTRWTASDGADADLLRDGSNQAIWSPLFVGMLKEVHAVGFRGTRGTPQDVVYKFVYGIEPETEGDASVEVAVLRKVMLPQAPGAATGAIEYGYRKGLPGIATYPGWGALLGYAGGPRLAISRSRAALSPPCSSTPVPPASGA